MGTNGGISEKNVVPGSSTQIPLAAGDCKVSHAKNRRSVRIWGVMVASAIASFYFDLNSRLQYAGLSVLFPGGAFLGLGGFWIIGLPIVLSLFGISLFLWFATGNIIAPFMTWFGLALWIPFLPQAARPTMLYSRPVVSLLAAISYVTIIGYMRNLQREKIVRSKARNEYLPQVITEIAATCNTTSESDEDREIPLEDLKMVRWLLDLAFQDMDDWTGFDLIEQFQPAALRYQINESNYTLAFVNRFYTPSFRGSYLQEAQSRLIRKYCQEKVLWYWKYECIWGKLSTNYEPVLKDNIMLTGFFLLALEVYRAATLDSTFTKDGALILEIDKNNHYVHSARTIAQALQDNWAGSPYCLYPCEPNWIYTFCNLYGINALKAYDTNEGTNYVSKVMPRFRKGFTEEFMDVDGSPVPIKSALTGFVVPGLVGLSNELACAMLTGSVMPDIATQSYAIAKQEYLAIDKNGEVAGMSRLVGVDKIDPGRYTSSFVTFYSGALGCAKAFGDTVLAETIWKLVEKDKSLKKTEKGGVVKWEGASVTMANQLFRGKLMFYQGWKRLVCERMPQHLREGPILGDVKYPEVLVAKACSHDGQDLEMVLYPGTEKKQVDLGLKQLQPGKTYDVFGGAGKSFQSDKKGEAIIRVTLDERTQVWVKPHEKMHI